MKVSMILFICIFFIAHAGHSQSLPWQKADEWHIYKVVDRKAIFAQRDSLNYFQRLDLRSDSVHYFLGDALPFKNEEPPAWLGAYLVSYQKTGAKPIKLLVSSYGGFVLDENQKLYQVVLAKQQAWLAFIGRQYERFLHNENE